MGSSEVVNFWVTLNRTSDNLNIQRALNVAVSDIAVTGSVAVVAGDRIEIKFTTPAWATNPTAVNYAAVVFIE